MILSTHILSEVQESCSHVQIINQGKLIFKETTKNLNQRMNTATIRVVTRALIDLEKFSDINSINHIENQANTSYLIHHNSNNNPIEQIAEIIVNSGWGLLEISPIKKSMEDIFISLTTEKETIE